MISASFLTFFLFGMAIFLAGLASGLLVRIPPRPKTDLADTLDGTETVEELIARCKKNRFS